MPDTEFPLTEKQWQVRIKSYHRRIQTAWTQEKWSKVIDLCAEFKRLCRQNFEAGGLGEPDNWPWYKNMFEDAQQKNGVPYFRIVFWDDVR